MRPVRPFEDEEAEPCWAVPARLPGAGLLRRRGPNGAVTSGAARLVPRVRMTGEAGVGGKRSPVGLAVGG